MKRLGWVLALAILAGLPVLATADDYDNRRNDNYGYDNRNSGYDDRYYDRYNYGDARRLLEQHQRAEYRQLQAHQRAERDACRYDRYNFRCRDLKRHQKYERDRLKAHQRRERDRLKNRFDARRDRRGRDGRYGYDGYDRDDRYRQDRRPGRF